MVSLLVSQCIAKLYLKEDDLLKIVKLNCFQISQVIAAGGLAGIQMCVLEDSMNFQMSSSQVYEDDY